jgi:4'-phosphopantetheinyl transferase
MMGEVHPRPVAKGGATLEALRARRQVQLWKVLLAAEASRYSAPWEILSAEEQERAGRFRSARDRERFVMARGRLRYLIGQYLSTRPGELVFEYGPQGKPRVRGAEDLQFNLAHSGDYAFYAFCAGARIGTDIELVRPMPDHAALARRFFSTEECNDLAGVPESQREDAFFACWTRKEAYVKAVGRGLSLPLDGFRVSLLPEATPELMTSPDGLEWSLFDVQPAAGYRGAVAIEGDGWTLHPMTTTFSLA